MPVLPHPNTGSSGFLRTVIQILEEFPSGLTTSQILAIALSCGSLAPLAEEGPKAPYLRVRRAIDSLLKSGFVRQVGSLSFGGKRQKVFALAPQAMDDALRDMLRQVVESIEGRIRNQFPLLDATQLVAAFEEVVHEDAARLGILPRKHRIGTKGLEIRKGDIS